MSNAYFIPRPQADSLSTLDFSQLERLRSGLVSGSGNQAASEEKVAQQFESLVIQQLLKQVRTASSGTIFDSEQTRMVQGMADDQMAMQLSNPGLGLAQVILEQIRRFNGEPQSGAESTTTINTNRNASLSDRFGTEQSNASSARNQDLPIASSISELIDVLTRPAKAIERVAGAARGSPEHIRDFVHKMSDAAHKAAAQSGVPAPLILSQAALESGWGKREILDADGTNSHNLFGIKATGGWKGKVVHILTTEYENGTPRKVMQPFRAYQSYEESFADYARLIGTNQRYSNVVAAPNAESAAHEIQKAGYATDPGYADKLISIMGYFHKAGGVGSAQTGASVSTALR